MMRKKNFPTTIPEEGKLSPHITPCFPGDPIYTEGCRAWANMKGARDCPYRGDTSKLQAGWEYWETDDGKRQRWFAGYNDTACMAEKRGTLAMVKEILGR